MTATALGDAIRVHIQVQGQTTMGASGKFFRIHRVGWQQPQRAKCSTIRAEKASEQDMITRRFAT